ncbi:thioredoxin domain-containing protein 3 homolog isoform X3 [Antedon mediterranea]|uniref:thioredoxin domain-containing protein 3 homolog isoform X3 n=1 Tax=Antedon mediterranea TaxID=105859 RepID=UPI003AF6EE4F
MPPKKEAVALQKSLVNQEHWDEMLATDGLTVVDIYQKWCGPCKAVQGLFRRLKNEIGDDLLHYATAEADGIESLERYRGRCEPCFLFYGGGELIDVVRGAAAPGLQHSIIHQLSTEHKVLEEGAERKVIKDPILASMEKQEKAAEKAASDEQKRLEEESMNEIGGEDISLRPVSEGKVRRFFDGESSGPVPKQVTVVLIKPDAVKAEKTPEIIEKIIAQGMEILVQEERTLTEEEAREFYKDQAGEDHFEDLVAFMASGPSCIMVLTKGDTGEGVVEEVREVIGPKDVEVAKTEAPDSLRAIFGTDKTMNALHGADSGERAARELSFFFPSFNVPNVPGTGPPPAVQKTLALIRPDALKQHKDSIIEKIQEAGFEVCLQKEIQLTEEQAKEFYKEQEGLDHFDELIQHMTNGPVLALGLAKEEAIQGWRNLIGPKEVDVAKEKAPDSLRAQFSITDSRINSLHGSDSIETAEKELDMFFPKEHTLAVIKPDATTEHKDAIIERITEAGFNIACQKDIHMDQDIATQLYKEHEGKEFYDQLISHMTSGPSMVMVLSREDAIDNWRTLMGPTDPEVAKDQAPESLRALLGKDILHNAIHGSSSKGQAVKKIKELFPEVQVTETGKVIVPKAADGLKDVKGESADEEDGEKKSDETSNDKAETSIPVAEISAPVAETTPPMDEEAKTQEVTEEATEEEKKEMNESKDNKEDKTEETDKAESNTETKTEEVEEGETIKPDGSDPVDSVEQKEEPEPADVKDDANPDESKPDEIAGDESKPTEEVKPPEASEDSKPEGDNEAKQESVEKAEDAQEPEPESPNDAVKDGDNANTESAEEPKVAEDANEATEEAKTTDEPAEEAAGEQPATETHADEKHNSAGADDTAVSKPEDEEDKPTEEATVESTGGGE